MTQATIIAKLNEVFAPLDAEVLESSQEWARGRVAALREYKASEAYAEISKKGAWGGMYTKLFAIAGGKTWYNVFTGNGSAWIENFVTKNCAAIVAKRNASIAKKLAAAGVTEVVSEKFMHTRDGFDGVFIVNTDNGTKRVSIDTIRAGGYNIQCLHLRVLVKVK
jgi:hypothetical protein